MNLAIAIPSLSDAATVVASDQISGMSAANLQRTQPGDRWRSGTLTPNLTIDLGSARSINLVSLLFTNASSTGQWRVRAADVEAEVTSSPDYDSGLINIWPATLTDTSRVHAILWLDTAQNYRYWRIDIDDQSNTDGYFQSGRLYMASAFQPDINIPYGWTLLPVDQSQKDRSRGGQLYTDDDALWFELRFTLQYATEDEMYGDVYEVLRKRGLKRDLLVIRDPEATDHLLRQTVYGQLTDLNPIENHEFQRFRTRITVEEMLP